MRFYRVFYLLPGNGGNIDGTDKFTEIFLKCNFILIGYHVCPSISDLLASGASIRLQKI